MPNDLVLAITGGSGAPYASRLLQVLLRSGRTVHIVVSPAGADVFATEMGRKLDLEKLKPQDLLPNEGKNVPLEGFRYWRHTDFRAGIASGSFLTAGMAICPCSMGTAAAIAHGISENLIHRAADVHLKERR